MTMRDRYFTEAANEFFQDAERMLGQLGRLRGPYEVPINSVSPTTPPSTNEFQEKYDRLKDYTTQVEQELFKNKEELKKSHEVIASLEARLADKPHWQKEVKTALHRISQLLQRLSDKM